MQGRIGLATLYLWSGDANAMFDGDTTPFSLHQTAATGEKEIECKILSKCYRYGGM
jgi:hypothetical protein